MYNTVIHNFKGYTPLIIIKNGLYSLCCTIYPCTLFDTCSSYLLITYPYTLLLPPSLTEIPADLRAFRFTPLGSVHTDAQPF